jgi:NAD(P)-dependent dehydrogenase (short-subunit alcohol dehydrogenase family)
MTMSAGKILVYGGSGAIGSTTARVLHSRGYALHLVGRDAAKLDAVAREVDATVTTGDVTDPALFERAANEARGPLDGLLYAVGTINLKSLQRLTEDDFLNDFRVNALGAAMAVRAALPALKQSDRTASIVLFSSVAVSQGFSFHASMGMAKGAIEGLTVSLAAELAPKIRINAIAPSLVRTPLAAGILSSEQTVSAIASQHALQRLGTPEDIAALAVYLLSPDAGWMTGQVIGIDGGRSSTRTKG